MGYTLNSAPDDWNPGGGTFTLIPEDTWVEAVVSSAKEQDAPWYKRLPDGTRSTTEKDRQVSFKFEVDYDGYERTIFGNTSTDFYDHPDCQLRNWVQEILGVDIPRGFDLKQTSDGEFPELISSRVEILVGVRTYTPRRKPEDTEDPKEKSINFAKDVRRFSGNSAAASYDPSNDPF